MGPAFILSSLKKDLVPNLKLSLRYFGLDFMYSDSVYELYERRQTIEIGGRKVPMLADRDLIDYLTLHGTAHCWHRLKWIYDVALVWKARGSEGRQTGLSRANDLRSILLLELLHLLAPI